MEVVFDTGPVISLAKACMLHALELLPFQPIIPPAVLNELVTIPLHTKQHMFEALRIRTAIEKGVIRTVFLSPRDREIAQEILRLANRTFYVHHRPLHILHRGEAEALALARITDHVLCVDERTTREIVEDPEALKHRLERKVHARVHVDRETLDELTALIGDILIIRSVEIAALAYENGLLDTFKEKDRALKALLYDLKFEGCSVSEEEIERFVP